MKKLAALAVIGAAFSISLGAGLQVAVAGDHYPSAAKQYRTVIIVRSGNPLSRSMSIVRVKYLSGTMQKRSGWGIVLTDVACTPDNQGVSHCVNAIHMRNGAHVVVRHNHSMHEIPCLAPGEKVFVIPRP